MICVINVFGNVYFMVFNAIFNNISVISWQSALLVEETSINALIYNNYVRSGKHDVHQLIEIQMRFTL
jgi:hypothetical protein